MGEKIWPEKMLPWIRKLANIVVAILTIALAYLAIISILEHFKDWNSGPGAGLIPSIDWPKWAVYLIIPYAFLVMGMRFIGIALEIFKPEKVVEFS
jgi:TRAP-type C4-dicarboxylate transport system permease small subunit